MKKLLGLVLAMCLLGALPGLADEAEDFAQANAMRYAYVEHVRSTYAQLQDTYGFYYKVSDAVEISSPDSVSPSYSCKVTSLWDEWASHTTFFATAWDPARRAYAISFNADRVEGVTIKDALTATIMLADDSLDLEQARAATNEIVLSFDGTGHSKAVQIKDCKIYVYDEARWGYTCIAMRPDDEYNYRLSDEAMALFVPVTYAELVAPLNTGAYVRFTAVPVKQEQKIGEPGYSVADIVTLAWDDGRTSQAVFDFVYKPIEFALDGSAYIIYGIVLDGDYTGTGTISLVYAERS